MSQRAPRPSPSRRGLFAAALAAATGATAEPPARPEAATADVAAKLVELFRRPKAPSVGELRALGADAGREAERLAGDAARPADVRERAVRAWALLAGATAGDGLAALAAEAKAPAPVRAAAIDALAQVRGVAAVEAIAPRLEDAGAGIRKAAAAALGRLGTAQGRTALRARLDAEGDPAVRATIERALARGAP